LGNRNLTKKITISAISISDLLAVQKPAHWPRSSFYCVRSALRVLASRLPTDQSFPIMGLPHILEEMVTKCSDSGRDVMSLLTYRGRIMRLAAEVACGGPLKAWEARWFFEALTTTHDKREDIHG